MRLPEDVFHGDSGHLPGAEDLSVLLDDGYDFYEYQLEDSREVAALPVFDDRFVLRLHNPKRPKPADYTDLLAKSTEHFQLLEDTGVPLLPHRTFVGPSVFANERAAGQHRLYSTTDRLPMTALHNLFKRSELHSPIIDGLARYITKVATELPEGDDFLCDIIHPWQSSYLRETEHDSILHDTGLTIAEAFPPSLRMCADQLIKWHNKATPHTPLSDDLSKLDAITDNRYETYIVQR